MKNAKKTVSKATTKKQPNARAVSEDDLKQVSGGKAAPKLTLSCATGTHFKKAIIVH